MRWPERSALSLLAAGGWAVIADDPFGGEPIDRSAGHLQRSGGPDASGAANKPGALAARRRQREHATARRRDAETRAAGSKTITIIDGSSGKRQQVIVGGGTTESKTASAADRLIETSRHGPLPRIAPGRRAAGRCLCASGQAASLTSRTRHASRSWSAGSASARPRPARRIAKLPGAGDAGVRPYGTESRRQVGARARGGTRALLAGAHGAIRLSRQRSRPADAADVA